MTTVISDGDKFTVARSFSSSSCVVTASGLETRPRKNVDVLGRKIGYVVPPEERQPIITSWTGMEDFSNCPPSYSIFYEQYIEYIKRLVRMFVVSGSYTVDDVTHDIIARFIERDSLGVFRPTWKTRSMTKRSVFRSYLSNFVVTYARGLNRNIYRHKKHYPLWFDHVVDEERGTTWGDENAPATEEGYSDVEFAELISDIECAAVDTKQREILTIVVNEALNCSTSVKVAALARRLRCSQSMAKIHLEHARNVIRSVIAAREGSFPPG